MTSSTLRWGSAMLLVGMLLIGSLLPAAASNAAVGRLNPVEIDALHQAIEEEYLAFNTYQAVLGQFENALPFSNVVNSEQQHIDAVANLFAKYGLAVPPNPGLDPVPTWETLKAACQTGVDAEIKDAALYDTLLPLTKRADLIRVFTNLQTASLTSHLPAFDACN